MDKENKKPKENIKEIKTKLDECQQGWVRTQADFDNYRKRTESQRLELISFANGQLIEKIFPILDNLELAIKHTPENLKDNDWVKGVCQIKKQCDDILAQEGLKKIPENGKFDPTYHEAISHEECNLEADEIIETLQTGYMLGDKVLRPAKVRVSCGKR